MARKRKGKKWYNILAPEMFGREEISETIADDPDKLIGRNISVSLINLVNDFKKYYMKFIFKITEVEGENALTIFEGSECMRDYISKMVNRWSTRVDTVQDLTTKDGVKIRVKGILIIPRRVKSSIKSSVRNDVRDSIKTEVERSTLNDVIKGIISDSIKTRVLRNAQRIYPVRNFEIRKAEILSR